MALIIERNEGLLERSWVAGVNVAELLISQVITQFVIIIVQIALMISITLWAFKVRIATHINYTEADIVLILHFFLSDLQHPCLQYLVDWTASVSTRNDRYIVQ